MRMRMRIVVVRKEAMERSPRGGGSKYAIFNMQASNRFPN